MNSCCDLIFRLLGFGGTNMRACPWWHRSLLTSLRGKESRHKAWNQIVHSDLPITVDNICRLTTKVKLLLCVWAASALKMEMKLLHTHSYWAKDLRGLGDNYILDRHSGRGFSFAPLQSETYRKEMLSEVYSEEAPDGGKTKGTSHYPPWGTCILKLSFSTLLCSLSTSCPRVRSISTPDFSFYSLNILFYFHLLLFSYLQQNAIKTIFSAKVCCEYWHFFFTILFNHTFLFFSWPKNRTKWGEWRSPTFCILF